MEVRNELEFWSCELRYKVGGSGTIHEVAVAMFMVCQSVLDPRVELQTATDDPHKVETPTHTHARVWAHTHSHTHTQTHTNTHTHRERETEREQSLCLCVREG
jgi:ABC-type nickel/cobalt efflux system permease component RcnA